MRGRPCHLLSSSQAKWVFASSDVRVAGLKNQSASSLAPALEGAAKLSCSATSSWYSNMPMVKPSPCRISWMESPTKAVSRVAAYSDVEVWPAQMVSISRLYLRSATRKL